MAVGRAAEAELVRVVAQLGLELQALLEGFPRIFSLEHLGLLQLAEIEVTDVPVLVVGEFIVRRQGWGGPRRRP